MRRTKGEQFQTIRSLGALLPPDVLVRVQNLDSTLPDLAAVKYGLAESDRLREAIERSWTVVQKHWRAFQDARAKIGERDETGTAITNEKWLIPLFQELGYGRLGASRAREIDGVSYPIARFWKGEGGHEVPIHCVGFKLDLDKRTSGVAGAARLSPHGLVQQYLNKEDVSLWAFVSNGLRLRILRDNLAVSRLSLVEFDLEAMMEGEVYSDFAIFWLCCHVTSMAAERPELCRLESWCKAGEQDGTRVLEHLKKGFEQAIRALGNGFLSHPANEELRRSLRDGEIDVQELYRQILRQVYRLLFLCVAEDRGLLHPPGADDASCQLYDESYSLRRLREIAGSIRGGKHGDLWAGLSAVFAYLDREQGCPELGLPGLGSFLWDPASTINLNGPAPAGCPAPTHLASLDNESLLESIRSLAFIEDHKVLRPVDYRNLDSEELGSVYEGLLEYVPSVNLEANEGENLFVFGTAAGNERKTSGSYYTPDVLVQCLLDTALDPVVEQAVAGKKPKEAEEAILNLKICDPAVGSGHFLLGAGRRLARHLARVRAFAEGEAEPSPLLYQGALRDVIGHCLYGVDINPMSAELCRVGMWLEALEPGKPLAFLDHHIRVGNSLMGATPELIESGIPDDAFNPLDGDERPLCTQFKRRNKQERRAAQTQLSFGAQTTGTDDYKKLTTLSQSVDRADDDSYAALLGKSDQFKKLLVSKEYLHQTIVADAWCAAFVWPIVRGGVDPITTETLRDLVKGPNALSKAQKGMLEELAKQFQFFHWHLAYPEVFSAGGFDCVLGNPPWEHVELKEKEWFADRDPEIADARTGAERKRKIKALEQDNPSLFLAFKEAAREHAGGSHFLGNSGRYPLCGRGRINFYAVFAELMRCLASSQGRIGAVLPTGIATDDTTKFFFQDVVQTKSLVGLLDFENRRGLFPEVDSRMKFSLFTAGSGTEPIADMAEFVFFALAVEELSDPERKFSLSPEDIELLNPNTRTCPIFRTRKDAELTKAIYRRVPVLIREARDDEPEQNNWDIRFKQGLFNMTSASHLFRNREQLERDGWHLDGNMFRKDGEEDWLPLYEAKMIHQYDHRWATYDGLDSRNPTASEKSDSQFSVCSRYWAARSEVDRSLNSTGWSEQWLFGWRDICRATDVRTLIATAFSPANSEGGVLLIIPSTPGIEYLALIGALNSFACDFVARQKVGGTHLKFFTMRQVPVPTWETMRQFPFDFVHRVAELVCTSDEMRPLLSSVDPALDLFGWDEERRFLIRCELDAAYFHLYGLNREDVQYVMEEFPILRRQDEAQYNGDYRTRDQILLVYDQIAAARNEGARWESPLVPKPGSN